MKSPSVIVRALKEEELPLQVALHLLEKAPSKENGLLYEGKEEGCMIRIYQKKSGEMTILFQGRKAKEEFIRSFPNEPLPIPKSKKIALPSPPYPSLFPQIGSDEVGTGDAFGPIVVVAAYIEEKDCSFLKERGIRDSKQLENDDIVRLFPYLKENFAHSVSILSPQKYNEVHKKKNMNAIKAILHNHTHLVLMKKFPQSVHYLDQFCTPVFYYRYLEKGKETPFSPIHFATKGESLYPSIALASCLARGYFLEEWQKMEERYDTFFPLGAGKNVQDFILKFVKEHGKDALSEVAKINFKNFQTLSE